MVFVVLTEIGTVGLCQDGTGGVGDKSGNSSLRLWLQASDLDQDNIDQERIEELNDKSGADNHVFASGDSRPFFNKPVSVPSGIQFRGGQFLQTRQTDDGFSNPEATVFLITRAVKDGTSIAIASSGWNQEMLLFNGGQYHHSFSGNFTLYEHQCIDDIQESDMVMISAVFGESVTDMIYRVNGLETTESLQTFGNPVDYSNVDRLVTLGQRDQFLNSEYLEGELLEVIVYNQKLSSEEILKVESYLVCKYNLNPSSCDDLDNDDYVIPSIAISDTICSGDSVEIAGVFYKSSGLFRDTISVLDGCDSLLDISITVFDTTMQKITVQICSGQQYEINNDIFTQTGSYQIELQSVQGCDSLIMLDLLVVDTLRERVTDTICKGDQYKVGEQVFNSTGFFEILLKNPENCDSIVMLDLIVKDTIKESIADIICKGDSVTYGGLVFKEAGLFPINLNASSGCDSLLILNLTVLDTSLVIIDTTICKGDRFNIAGRSFTIEGVYPIELENENGCDSTILLNLKVTDGLEFNMVIVDSISCFGANDGTIRINSSTSERYTILWNTGDTSKELSGLSEGVYVVDITDKNNCRTNDSVLLKNPQLLDIDFSVIDIDCDQVQGGVLEILSIIGGRAPFEIRLNNELIIDSKISGLDARRYELTVTDNNQCKLDTFFRISDFTPLDSEVLLDVSNENPNLGDTIRLDLSLFNINEPIMIEWIGINHTCDTCTSVDVQIGEGISVYSAKVTDAFGCTYEVSTSFNIQSSFMVPNAFTPNDDGLNDGFIAFTDASVKELSSMRVFNRLGDLVFFAENITPNIESQGWDGKLAGILQDPGVFVYVIEYFDGLGRKKIVVGDCLLYTSPSPRD